MRVLLEAHRLERIRASRERESQAVKWPSDLPLPNVGDEIIWYGNYVRVVGRSFDFEDDHVTLFWRDTRHEEGWDK